MSWPSIDAWRKELLARGEPVWAACQHAEWLVVVAALYFPNTVVGFVLAECSLRSLSVLQGELAIQYSLQRVQAVLHQMQRWCAGEGKVTEVRKASEKAADATIFLSNAAVYPGYTARQTFRAVLGDPVRKSSFAGTAARNAVNVDAIALSRARGDTAEEEAAQRALSNAQLSAWFRTLWRWSVPPGEFERVRVALDLAEETLGPAAVLGRTKGGKRILAPNLLLVQGTAHEAGSRLRAALEVSGFVPCSLGWVWIAPVGPWLTPTKD